jgi:HD-like signal output (HDOD) protein
MLNWLARVNPNYGKGTSVLADTLLDSDELANLVQRLFSTPGYDPPVLPKVALEVHRLSHQPNTTFIDLERVVVSDAMLSARLLRAAQSPHYAGSAPMRSIRDAIGRLDMRTIGNLFLAVAMNTKVYRSKTFAEPMEQLRMHSQAVAQATRLVGRHTGLVYEDYGYLAGLLHDVGLAGILLALGEPAVAGKLAAEAAAMPMDELMMLATAAHEAAGLHFAKAWKLPDDLVLVIERHHSDRIDGHVHPVTSALVIAESLAAEAGHGGVEQVDESTVAHACHDLSVTDASLDAVRKDLARELGGASR